jgi:hypothetical protein
MITHRIVRGLIACLGIVLGSVSGWAQNEGQADLDKATDLQLRAQNLEDIKQVTKLCEEALKKGLDEGNAAFAKQLLSSSLFQHASR